MFYLCPELRISLYIARDGVKRTRAFVLTVRKVVHISSIALILEKSIIVSEDATSQVAFNCLQIEYDCNMYSLVLCLSEVHYEKSVRLLIIIIINIIIITITFPCCIFSPPVLTVVVGYRHGRS